ncbi:MAG: hypothetical protein JSV68_17540 [Anaerolineaceae bacterium]|jgi:hypothetical protein|nr:MAG: hypothetical protein JSV68_17540 [Anaerolineaceae bacterium]
MSIYFQQNNTLSTKSQVRSPRVTPVAFSSGLILAFLLIFFQLPWLVSAGLWLLGMALVLILYAFVSYHRFAIPVWDTAIVGQVAGLLGTALLLVASLISF